MDGTYDHYEFRIVITWLFVDYPTQIWIIKVSKVVCRSLTNSVTWLVTLVILVLHLISLLKYRMVEDDPNGMTSWGSRLMEIDCELKLGVLRYITTQNISFGSTINKDVGKLGKRGNPRWDSRSIYKLLIYVVWRWWCMLYGRPFVDILPKIRDVVTFIIHRYW